MINLKKESGLEISLTDSFRLGFDNPELEIQPDIRYAIDMSAIILDQKAAKEKKPLYYTYRNIGYLADRDRAKQENLRYDITILLPDPIGQELNKTKGHYHSLAPSGSLSYPEVYQIISGQALFLIQRFKDQPDQIVENYLIEAKQGRPIVIPPNFGHITINPGPKPLVMANWVEANFENLYESYEELKGGSYYLLKDSPYQSMKNANYQKVVRLERLKPKEQTQFGLEFGQPIYQMVKNNIFQLDFLRQPQKYDLSIAHLYSKPKN